MGAPTISVITPCYNGERYLHGTLSSVLGQTHRPLEVIVVDDGSTDRSAAIAESFDAPVRTIRQHNQGESAARNRGIAEARGTHLLFLDADDVLRPQALASLAVAATGPCVVPLMGYSTFTITPDQPTQTIAATREPFLPHIIRRNPGVPHCYLTPAALVKQVGGFCPELKYFEDWDLWCQIALTGAELVPIDYVGALYRRHPDTQTRRAPKNERKLGHVAVVDRFLAGLLRERGLVERHGTDVFWPAWGALRTALDLGIPWEQLASLAEHIEQLVRRGPTSLRRSRIGRLVRFVGLRRAMSLQRGMVSPSGSSPEGPPDAHASSGAS